MSSPSTQQSRKYLDCREFPREKNRSLKISGTEDEVLDAAVQHAISAHGHENTTELRQELRQLIKDDLGENLFLAWLIATVVRGHTPS